MTVLGEALRLIKEVLRLTDEMQRIGAALGDIAAELREHDRRITRLEAQWTTALQLATLPRSLPPAGE
jgi:hypothetical protein